MNITGPECQKDSAGIFHIEVMEDTGNSVRPLEIARSQYGKDQMKQEERTSWKQNLHKDTKRNKQV